MDVEGGALAYYALESPDMDTAALSWFIDDTVSRRLLAVSGVQQITRNGGSKREITVTLRPGRLESLGISAAQINSQLVQTNVDVPAGRLTTDDSERSLRVPGSAADITALAATPIALNDGRRVPLGELADIRDGHGEIRSRARLNGREVVGFSVYRSKGTSDTTVASGVEQTVAALQAENPHIRIRQVHSSVDATRENYHTAIDTLIEGAVLTVLVVYLFLRDWRATLVAAIALPLSILPAFLVMQLSGYTLNSVTLLGLTLVIGILVDDAIVEIENIDKHLMLGKRPYQAAIDAADAIGFAVIAITGTIVAVFLPVSFTGGMIGQYFSQFGTTVSAAVLASLLTARLATPLLAAYLLAPAGSNHHHKPQSCLMRAYLRLLEWTLRHRKTTLSAAALILAASWQLLPLLPTGFMPRADTGFSQLNINLPPGSTLAQTDATLRHLSDITNRYPAASPTPTPSPEQAATPPEAKSSSACAPTRRAHKACVPSNNNCATTSPPSPTSASPSKTKKPSATSTSSSPARTPPPSAQPRTPSNNKYKTWQASPTSRPTNPCRKPNSACASTNKKPPASASPRKPSATCSASPPLAAATANPPATTCMTGKSSSAPSCPKPCTATRHNYKTCTCLRQTAACRCTPSPPSTPRAAAPP